MAMAELLAIISTVTSTILTLADALELVGLVSPVTLAI